MFSANKALYRQSPTEACGQWKLEQVMQLKFVFGYKTNHALSKHLNHLLNLQHIKKSYYESHCDFANII